MREQSVERAGTDQMQGTTAGKTAGRRLPIGAEVQAGGGTHFRLWAPRARIVAVEVSRESEFRPAEFDEADLAPEPGGYFSGFIAAAKPGMFYRYKLESGAFPDPVSRYQPHGPHGPSQIIDPSAFRWSDKGWGGVGRKGQVIYELHIGTFTPEGTWAAAARQLEPLARLGVTLLEVMPVAEFPGRFGWGYDGVDLFAPTRLYGDPDAFRAFVDRAHALGLGVVLDVVYNHIGPDGNFLKEFSEDYFTTRYKNEWGEAINFDGPNSGPVREFFCANAGYWVDEFHIDGLRLDATQQIFDASAEHILAMIGRAVRAAAKGRATYVVAENESQEAKLVRPLSAGGYGLDALWNDDFHHCAKVALTGRSEAYYSSFRGSPQEFISAVRRGFLYQGQWFSWQRKSRGSPAFDISAEQFVNFLQNHDQIANSLTGLRLHQLSSPGQLRALTTLLLLGPGTPLLFQGQEFSASAPFLFFADHNPELSRLVARGRRQFLRQFPSIASAPSQAYLAPPGAEQTFAKCKLDLAERETHREVYVLHQDLLRMRREDPVFSSPRAGGVDGAVLGVEAFALRFFGPGEETRLLLVNLGMELSLECMPEPLLAPPAVARWTTKWSSEDPKYGGAGTPPFDADGQWQVAGHAAVVFEPQSHHGKADPSD